MLKNNKQIVLALMSGSHKSMLPVAHLILAAELFDIPSASLRVALGRLAKDGTITQVKRGYYGISEKGRHMENALKQWTRFDELTKPWKGGWLACYIAHLGRVDRKQLVRRERALSMSGFACLEQGLWIRPNNMSHSLAAQYSKLVNLGLEKEAYLMEVAAFTDAQKKSLPELWDIAKLEQTYKKLVTEIEKSMRELPNLNAGEAAKQTLEVGHLVISSLGFDPLLPEEMVNTQLRSTLCQKMLAYDEIGQQAWKRFYKQTVTA